MCLLLTLKATFSLYVYLCTYCVWIYCCCCSCSARFYFLGDDDLLEVLGQAASLGVIQAHLKQLFAGIHRVRTVHMSKDSICTKARCTEQ